MRAKVLILGLVLSAVLFGALCEAARAQDADPAKDRYLDATKLFREGKHEEAVTALEPILTGPEDGDWFRKARFLLARALIEGRRFEEAEKIYEEEARRLLSEERKKEIAGLIVSFADALAKKPDPDDPGAPKPDHRRAHNLYRKALEMEIGRDLRDGVMFRSAGTLVMGGDHHGAIREYQAYLTEFDPDWTGPVGSVARRANRRRENPPPAGRHVRETRFELAKAQIAAGGMEAARTNLEDLLALMGPDAERDPLAADARWQILRTYGLPGGGDLERGVKAVRDFLSAHAGDPRAVAAAGLVAASYRRHGRADQAIEAYEAFIARTGFLTPEGGLSTEKHPDLETSPAEVFEEGRKRAQFRIGEIRAGQGEFKAAIEAWRVYVNSFPNGPHWADAQRGIIDAEFRIGLELVTEKAYDRAREQFGRFLAKYPLDARARQILFTLGQIRYARALEMEEKEEAGSDEVFRAAVREWGQLVSKYPNTEESSLALYRTGTIHEERLGDLEKALEAYRRLTWGSWAGKARARVAAMTKKHLALETRRKFRTNETAKVKVSVRNIEKVTVKQYTLSLEAFFRKTHGARAVEALDIALIQPDKTWEVEIEGYGKYRPIEQEIEVPFPAGKGGVCLINVSEEDFEATTLVIRSDLDLIVRVGRKELLVFAQDMVADEPASGVTLLLSDGKKVFGTGATGRDGVYRGRFDELSDLADVRVFAKRDGSVASNVLSLRGLRFSAGLSPKGYLYTDRPAYLPGQSVRIRGILRNVKDGSYAAPAGEEFVVAVTDSGGRLLWEEKATLSEFGTFSMEVELSPHAARGEYVVTARRDEKGAPTFRGVFLVRDFKLEKMRLRLGVPQAVYFRGETVELEIGVEYYWGEPVTGRDIRYWLPDGRSFVQRPDEEGKLTVEFDTTGLAPGVMMVFRASIEGENVTGSHRVLLARTGFGMTVTPARDLVLSGEPFDVVVTTKTPDGKPLGKSVTLFVLRRKAPQADPVLGGVPWIRMPARPASEVTVKELEVTTDEKTGEGTVRLTLDAGGAYILRASGEDRFEQVVSAERTIKVSDEEDETKLRLFAESGTLRVGEKVTFRLHSRLDARLALLTFDGEEILAHRVVRLEKGMNDVTLDVGHEHFPNFRASVALLDGKHLRTAAMPFKVERELKVTVTSLREAYAPGATGKVRVKAVDQLGKPVRAELSLALVDEALFALFSDRTPKILDFFQKGAVRRAEFRVAGTSGFRYEARTRQVVKAFLEEQERKDRAKSETAAIERLRQEGGGRSGRGYKGPPADKSPPALREPGDIPLPPGTPAPLPRPAAKGRWKDGKDPGAPPAEPVRRELPEAGFWLPAVVTGDDGIAEVEVPMPETTTEWRLTARGVTVSTLVGEATGKVVTRKDFFVELKAPGALTEGDRIRVLARVHNLSDHEGEAELRLEILGGPEGDRKLLERRATAKVKAGATTEALFESVLVPAETGLTIRVSARAGDLFDAVSRPVPVRPWGLEFVDHGGGTATGDAAAILELPGGREYRSRWLTVTVGPSLERAVIEMALGTPVRRRWTRPPRWGGHAGSDLLAAAYALEYADAVQAPRADRERLLRRARALVASLVTSQRRDQGWGWPTTGDRTDLAITARAYWALCKARDLGLAVNAETLSRAKGYLENAFRSLAANDNDGKAIILHALSTGGEAEFAHANRLYRERNSLSTAALCHTALAFVSLGRNEFAVELLDVLEKRAAVTREGSEDLCSWSGGGKHVYLKDDRIEATALALLLMLEVRPGSPKVRPAVDYLLDRRGTYGFTPAKARGPAVAALAAYFEKGKYAETDARIAVLVDGRKVRTIESRGARPLTTFRVPVESLPKGKVIVEFRKEGRGEYAYGATLRGFTPDLAKVPRTLGRVRGIRRHYYHANLRYRGRDIGVASTSPVTHVEVGQRIRVYVDLRSYSATGYWVMEEPLPSGFSFVEGSLKGSRHHEIRDGKLIVHVRPGVSPPDLHYELVGYATGEYPVLPTVVRDTQKPELVWFGNEGRLTVLPPGEVSDDTYAMNLGERYTLGKLCFDDGRYQDALEHLTEARKMRRDYREKEVAHMLLWIYTSPGFYDARSIVEVFEVLRERYPELEIPFDKILVVGRAYHDIGEFERAYLVFRATIDASFISDAGVSAVLEDEGQFLGSVDYQKDLWREYPDTAEVVTAYFALSQALYRKAPQAHELAKQERRIAMVRGREGEDAPRAPDRIEMLRETIRLLERFLALYPKDPLADDAAFSMANAFLDLKQYKVVVELCREFAKDYSEGDFATGFKYMEALGHFWQHDHDKALAAGKVVGEGDSKDRDFARYIVGQIYHAKGNPADAILWYRKVEDQYPDAREAIAYFEEKRIALEEVTVVRPGEDVELTLEYRNIKEVALKVYRVDLMKLYLREKNLSNITRVHLAGIQPELTLAITLGDGKDYVDKEQKAKLGLTEEAAYLVICRGDDLFASGLVLITPLDIEVQEDQEPGRVRVNVLDRAESTYAGEVHVKAIGSADKEFRSGETDLRGVFIADNLRGKATVIARAGDSRYAFYRGEQWLGAPEHTRRPPPSGRAGRPQQELDFRQNLRESNRVIQDQQMKQYDELRRARQSGVQIQKAR